MGKTAQGASDGGLSVSAPRGPLAGETIWYEDSARKQVHRDLAAAGMKRARRQGKGIGRPRVSERPKFNQRFAALVELMKPGGLSRNQAAREPGIGYATLQRRRPRAGQRTNGQAIIQFP